MTPATAVTLSGPWNASTSVLPKFGGLTSDPLYVLCHERLYVGHMNANGCIYVYNTETGWVSLLGKTDAKASYDGYYKVVEYIEFLWCYVSNVHAISERQEVHAAGNQ